MQPTGRIPGSQMQVNLFLNDAANGTVKVGPNTVYTLWIGGNDLSAAADKIMKGGLSNIINALGSLLVGTAWNNYLTLNKLLDQQSVPVNHLYLFTLFNSTKIVPKVQGWSSSMKFLDSIVSVVYEKSLNLVVELEQKAHPNASIHLVPTYTWFANMASNKAPYASLFPASNIGKACELGNMAYANAQTPTANCQGYMFWNQEHPSTSVEQIVGYQFEQEVAKPFNQKDSSMDLALANTAPMTLAQQKAWLKQQIIAMLKKEIASKF
jgi:phospholipase/lecithinase/hemolysin